MAYVAAGQIRPLEVAGSNFRFPAPQSNPYIGMLPARPNVWADIAQSLLSGYDKGVQHNQEQQQLNINQQQANTQQTQMRANATLRWAELKSPTMREGLWQDIAGYNGLDINSEQGQCFSKIMIKEREAADLMIGALNDPNERETARAVWNNGGTDAFLTYLHQREEAKAAQATAVQKQQNWVVERELDNRQQTETERRNRVTEEQAGARLGLDQNEFVYRQKHDRDEAEVKRQKARKRGANDRLASHIPL